MHREKRGRVGRQPKYEAPLKIYFRNKMRFWDKWSIGKNCSQRCSFTGNTNEADVLLTDYGKLNKVRTTQSTAFIKLENVFRCFKSTNVFYNALFYVYYFLGSSFHLDICCPRCFSNIDDVLKDVNYLFHFDRSSDVLLMYTPMNETRRINGTLLAENVENKTGVAYTYISHCSEIMWELGYYRTMYIDEMSRYMDIHSYGKCGKNKRIEPEASTGLEAKQITGLDYKFFLVFENSIAYDYVSEKLWHGMECLYTVPVYLGAPNVFDYFKPEVLAKYKLFVYANNYLNPMDLANYLNYLNSNVTAYMEYFQWKLDGVDVLNDKIKTRSSSTRENYMCEICDFILGE
jgi:hypothetical protein